ncbi:hydroxyacid dehydrogenase [Candidatus Thorarchaeota archaeon]|nr:MAG: hydroxyacid dehydrogenase [Candidatus Thorarchaeota archaeon]
MVSSRFSCTLITVSSLFLCRGTRFKKRLWSHRTYSTKRVRHMVRVLIADPIAASAQKRIEDAGFDVVVRDKDADGPISEQIKGFDCVIVRSATKVTKEVLEAADNLKLIVRAGVGLDNIDLKAAEEVGVKVMNTPEAPTVSVAEMVFALMFGLARNITQGDSSMKEEKWNKKLLKGTELWQKKLGVIGFGRIGKEIARRGTSLGMDVLIVEKDRPGREEECAEVGARQVPLDELIEESDYLTVNVPLVPETEGMIGLEELKRMKESAYLINTARGGVVDEEALLKALDQDMIAGAGLDVHVNEPPKKWDLVKHPKVVATPHLASSTSEAQVRVGELTADKVINEFK